MPKLMEYQDIINGKPIHIATVTPDGNPNLAVASDVLVLDDRHLLISVNEMTHTQENIKANPKVVVTAFDKDWKGVRLFCTASFYTNGEYYDMCKRKFFANGEVTPFGATEPKGAIVVKVAEIKEFI